ncbi:MAG: hypothetical protein ACI9KE_004574 [Polyangiales bacterium]|jgi:hypothetical protein
MSDSESQPTPPAAPQTESTASSVIAAHETREKAFRAEAAVLESKGSKVSLARLVAFLAIAILGSAGFSQESWPLIIAGSLCILVFVFLIFVHSRVETAREEKERRADVHARHVLRLTGRFTELPAAGRVPPGHPYAHDIDLVGENSLCQRIDVTHTVSGEHTLSLWLSVAAKPEDVRQRQEAVIELSAAADFRESLEAFGARAAGKERLDPGPFLAFTGRKDLVRGSLLVPAIFVLPTAFIVTFVLSQLGMLTPFVSVALLGLQAVVAFGFAGQVIDVFQMVAARRGYVEALKRMLVAVEKQTFSAPLLVDIQKRVHAGGRAPSEYMARLDRWAGLAEFYTQFPVHFFVNVMVLWDLHILLQLERWNSDVGQGLEEAFDALGELEALASLATLHHGDPSATFPDICDEPVAFMAEGLAHPLLPAENRITNDVRLPGVGSALIVTGSNMAGKSTLLRSVGLNIALAFAGGPVVADKLRLSSLRLRASMRVDDSLQQGASYFHAELAKLRSVVGGAENEPPVFFLLDELLRGTNARARHLGARAVLMHLLDRGASGLTATHDIALSKMESEHPGRIENVHFTDVMRDDEMFFDYKLRDGVVRTSNALRLLQMAGVEVEVDDQLPTQEG